MNNDKCEYKIEDNKGEGNIIYQEVVNGAVQASRTLINYLEKINTVGAKEDLVLTKKTCQLHKDLAQELNKLEELI